MLVLTSRFARLCCATALAALAGCSTGGAGSVSFDPAAFQAHVDYLADDARDGRGLGTPGIEQAAEYIADQFAAIGLEPAGDDDSYFQSLTVRLHPELGDDSRFTLTGVDFAPAQGADYVPFPFSSATAFDGDVVFAGYGIVAGDRGCDDYAHLDVAGKVVLILRREPPAWTEEEGDATPNAHFSNKVYTAKEHGAAAVLIVNQEPADGESDGESDDLIEWSVVMGGDVDFGLPAFHITRVLADRMLSAGGANSLSVLQEKLDGGERASVPLVGIRLAGKADVVRKEQPTRNVLGMLRGEGLLADEIVVIGAHYDHLGIIVPRVTFGKKKSLGDPVAEIHNGADDNASGTAGVIELARALAAHRGLSRSVLFMAFTGEESGLLGSKYFVENPTVPLDRVVAMLNLDMIGRLKDGSRKVQVFGTQAADGFNEMLIRLAKGRSLEIQGSASAFGPSDHTSFYSKKIPALHFFTGLHTDYHLPSDDAEKINASGAAQVLGLVYDTACAIITAKERPKYHRVARPQQSGKSAYHVRMGIMPGYTDSVDGMAVDGVFEDGPAEKAGMQDGDKIVRIGESEIKNVHDYMAALRKNNPGDEVVVDVERDGKHITLKVKLAGE